MLRNTTVGSSRFAANSQNSSQSPTERSRGEFKQRGSTTSRDEDEDDYVGFATLPEQVHRKAVKRGFDFTIMVVGETGLGKSTLINSLFLNDLYKDRVIPDVQDRLCQTVEIERKSLEIEERGVKLRLTIVDTPGFNEAINAENCWRPVIGYIDDQFAEFFHGETGLHRKHIQDNRVHCCVYVLSPYGRGLKPIDVSLMKMLHNKVNIVPVIGKADCLTKKEIYRLKQQILNDISTHQIKIYEFPDCDSDEDEEFKQQDKQLKAAVPFAVVGSNAIVEVGGKKVRGRVYPWGIVEVDNLNHCDFSRLRQMLISTHMQDLKEITMDVHYENYRAQHLAEQLGAGLRERGKLKRDSSPNFDAINVEAEKQLAEKDAEIQRMQAMLMKMQEQLKGKPDPPTNGPNPNRKKPTSPTQHVNGILHR